MGLFTLVAMWAACIPEAPAPAPEELTAASAPEPAPAEAYVVGQTTLRKAPTDERKIPDPDGGGDPVANWIATLHRAERVTFLAEDGDWARIALSDDTEGWVKSNRIVRGAADAPVKVATLLDDGQLFDRPDMLALDTDRTIPKGAVVFVVQTKEPFAEVDYPRSLVSSSRGWTLASALTSDPIEVDAAKLVAKVLELRSENDPSAQKVEELARTQYAASRLLALLDPPAPDGGTSGEGATEPSLEPTEPPIQP